MHYHAVALAAIGLAFGAAPLAANPGTNSSMIVEGTAAAQRENIVLRVPANVDLSDPLAVRDLRAQATRTIEQVCNPGDRLNADMSPDFQCRREMGANLEVALTRLAAPALARR